jgi:hypothetical protein
VLRILALALVFGFLVAGCDNGGTWTNVTDLTKVAGTWKTSYKTEGAAYGGVQMNDFYGIHDYEDGYEVALEDIDEDGDGTNEVNEGDITITHTLVKIMVLTDVEVDTETEITVTIAATDATTGTRATVTTTKRTYSGDSLEAGFGYAVTDPEKTSRNGWSLIKNAVAGGFAAPYNTGFTVNDTDNVISSTITSPVTGTTPINSINALLSSDGTMLLYNSRVYIKQ